MGSAVQPHLYGTIVRSNIPHSVVTAKTVDSFKVKLKTHSIVSHLHDDIGLLFNCDIHWLTLRRVQLRLDKFAHCKFPLSSSYYFNDMSCYIDNFLFFLRSRLKYYFSLTRYHCTQFFHRHCLDYLQLSQEIMRYCWYLPFHMLIKQAPFKWHSFMTDTYCNLA